MNLPQVYTCSQSWTSLPVPSLWVIPLHQPQASCILYQTCWAYTLSLHYFCFYSYLCSSLPYCSLPFYYLWKYFSSKTYHSWHLCGLLMLPPLEGKLLEDKYHKVGTAEDFIFLGSKIIADSDCSHEIKRRLLHGRKVMTNLDSILKSTDVTLLTKVCIIKAMLFWKNIVMYGCESWATKKT